MDPQALRRAVAKLLRTARPAWESPHAKGRAEIYHSVKRAERAKRRKMSRYSRRVNRHRAGSRRSTRPPR